jgi:anti-anti-sigma regulatory factor
MAVLPGTIAGISFSAEDLTSPQGLLVLGLGGLVLVLWILGLVLVRGFLAKAAARSGDAALAPLAEVKDLLDGLHENLSKLSDAMELFRDKSENRIGSMARAMESLPRINEGVAKIREALPGFEKILKETAGSAAGGYEQKIKEDLQRALVDLKAREEENKALHKDLEKFHETMQAQALDMDRGNAKALKEKYDGLEKERKTFDEQKAAFLRHQDMIKGQIKEAGEKLRRVQEEVKREKEEVARLKAQGPGDATLKEDRAKLEREWEMLQQQQQMLKGERDWLEAERYALNEEKKLAESSGRGTAQEALAPPAAPPPAPAAAPVSAPPVRPESSAFRATGDTQEMVADAPAGARAPAAAPKGDGQSGHDLKAWGYSSLAEDGPPAPVAQEEDIAPAAAPAPAPEAAEPESGPPEGPEAAPAPAPAAASGGWESVLTGAHRAGDTSVKGVIPAADLPGMPAPDAAPPEAPAPEAAPEAPAPASPAASEAPVDTGGEGEIQFQEREQGWAAARWNGILFVRLDRDEVKNDEAHALDAIVFQETEGKEDRILLDLSKARYVNSRGLSSLTKIAVQRTAHLALANENVLRVMDMMGFLPLFTIFPDTDAALEAFSG